MQNALGVMPQVLCEAIKRASIGRGKDSAYSLIITTKVVEDKNCCSIVCSNGNMQATSAFYAKLIRIENVDGKDTVVKEPLENNIFIHAAPVLRDSVEALSEVDEKIMLVNEEKGLIAKNRRSIVPIPTLEASVNIENPKGAKKIEIEVERSEIEDALKYVSATLSQAATSHFGSNYGLMPMMKDEKAVLHIAGCDEKSISYKEIEATGLCDDFAEKCKDVTYAMVPTEKLSQIISTTAERVRFVFFYADDQVSVKQVNIKIGNDLYQILTSITQRYPQNIRSIVEEAYLTMDASFITPAKGLKNAFAITSLGKDASKVKSIMLVREGSITISNENGDQKTEIAVETQLAPGMKEVRISVVCSLMLSLLKPYNERIKIQGSHEDNGGLITFIGDDDSIRMAMFPVLTDKGKKALAERRKREASKKPDSDHGQAPETENQEEKEETEE